MRKRWLALCVLCVAGFVLYRVIRENWHSVLPGAVYRSGQLQPGALKARIKEYGLRTIINMRGPNQHAQWYCDEVNTARECGVAHFDFVANSYFAPTEGQLRELIGILDRCEKPVLVHCESGIDRSGPAAAVSILLFDREGTPEKALEQLTSGYGHLPWRASTERHRGFIELYRNWLATADITHSPEQFRRWATELYVRPMELSEYSILQASR